MIVSGFINKSEILLPGEINMWGAVAINQHYLCRLIGLKFGIEAAGVYKLRIACGFSYFIEWIKLYKLI